MAFLDEQKLTEAVAIHEASYGLLKWLSSAVEQGFVRSATAHEYMNEVDAAAAWIAEHYANIPPSCRPAAREGDALERFARFFTSFLRTSFDVADIPRARRISTCGCGCSLCGYVVSANSLQPKRVNAADKGRAEKRKRVSVDEIVSRARAKLSDASMARLAKAEDAALVAYAADLIHRCYGAGTGTTALALWRQIAWKDGCQKRGFKLTVRAIQDAEARLVERIRSEAGAEGVSSC